MSRPIPEKVILWLTDPFVIEVEGFVPPENTRIVPVDTHQHDTSTLRENNEHEISQNVSQPEPSFSSMPRH
jgi:hypothetical protein